jgi:hypothetical protein
MILDAAETVLRLLALIGLFMKILGIIERKRNGMTNYKMKEQKIFKKR